MFFNIDTFFLAFFRTTEGCKCRRSHLDRHPYCPKCRRQRGIKECYPSDTCIHCVDTPLEDWGTLLYNQSRREKRDSKVEAKMASPRHDKPPETTSKTSAVATAVTISEDDDLLPMSGTPRRQKLSLRRTESIQNQELSSSSDSATESEKDEVASIASGEDAVWQDSVDPTQIVQTN